LLLTLRPRQRILKARPKSDSIPGGGNGSRSRIGRLEARVEQLAKSTLKALENFNASFQAINKLRVELKNTDFKIDSLKKPGNIKLTWLKKTSKMKSTLR
jgi:hypothetical protein